MKINQLADSYCIFYQYQSFINFLNFISILHLLFNVIKNRYRLEKINIFILKICNMLKRHWSLTLWFKLMLVIKYITAENKINPTESMWSKLHLEQRAENSVRVLKRKTRVQSFEKLGTTLSGESTSCRCYFRLLTQSSVTKWIEFEWKGQQWIENKPLFSFKTDTPFWCTFFAAKTFRRHFTCTKFSDLDISSKPHRSSSN